MSNNTAGQNEIDVFKTRLKNYKNLLDEDIAVYSKKLQKNTLQDYGRYSRLTTDVYLDILNRGGKRIRGALTILGYEMCGGTDLQMIIQAARAIEMIHAYMLIIDDIQDRSTIRRGGPSAHSALANYHREHQLSGGADHFGVALALNSALAGAHAAQMTLANLDTDNEHVIKVLSILNRTMVVTAHGQTNDIVAEVVADTSMEDVENILEWKTAHYTLLNPLHTGMVLAGADCNDTDAITPYAIHAGKAFQIADDILGTFGTEFESGKSPMDDVREGKRTILSVYALRNASDADKNFLVQVMGDQDITQAEFQRTKDILSGSGALEYARNQAGEHVKLALKSLSNPPSSWNGDSVEFLRLLAKFISTRKG